MLTNEQRTFYDENGYLLVKGLLSREDALAYRREAHALIDRLSQAHAHVESTWGSARELAGAGTQIFHRHNVEYFSAAFHRLLLDDRLTAPAAGIADHAA